MWLVVVLGIVFGRLGCGFVCGIVGRLCYWCIVGCCVVVVLVGCRG